MQKEQSRVKEKSRTAEMRYAPVAGGKKPKETHCARCGGLITDISELCPHCMHPLAGDSCTFCGGVLYTGDLFCCACGNPAQGVVCNRCGTLNFRNFCYRCHEPVTEQAHEAQAQAAADPLFRAMTAKMEAIAVLEAELQQQQEIEQQDSQREMEKQQEAVVLTPVRLLKEQYKEMVTDLNALLAQFAPDAETTPAIQRDYFSARMIPFYTSERAVVRSGWICNYCGCHHHVPEECVRPWMGGVWKYEEKEVITEKWKYEK